jgi:O-antigen/teichoic acid export membrane protein
VTVNLETDEKQRMVLWLSRAREWARLIAITGSAQVTIQAIGFLSGILVVRVLSMHEYALYTLANTMLGTLAIFADGGISTGVMSLGGKVWPNAGKVGAVLVTGLELRKTFATYSALVAIPVLFYLLLEQEPSWTRSAILAVTVALSFYLTSTTSLLEIIPKLYQRVKPLQELGVTATLARLMLICLTLFAYPTAAAAIACAGATHAWLNWRLRQISFSMVEDCRKSDSHIRREILSTVKQIMPVTIYYCISGQLSIWLISLYGTTAEIAQVGALSRLAMLLNTIGMVTSTLVVPRFARLPDCRTHVLRRYLQVLTVLTLIGIIIVALVSVFPKSALVILGGQYSGLTREVVLLAAGSCVGMVAGGAYAMSISRGIIIPSIVVVSVGILSQSVLILLLRPMDVSGILTYSIYLQFVNAAFYFFYFVFAHY